jgi:hypothetical protein
MTKSNANIISNDKHYIGKHNNDSIKLKKRRLKRIGIKNELLIIITQLERA